MRKIPGFPGRDKRTTPENSQPYGIIQWKGTDVCMDAYCKCGEHFHIDAEFAYYIRCPECKTVFMCDPYVKLIELTKEEEDEVFNVV